MTDLAAHLLLFLLVGVGLLALPLWLGKLVRPSLPTPQKDSIYECGEPTIGPSTIQFDLRFYVVALLFILFDVEVVFFFPWAAVFGQTAQLADPRLTDTERLQLTERLLQAPAGSLPPGEALSAGQALSFGWLAAADVAVFLAVLLVGFAYIWKRGDLDWVRALTRTAPIARHRSIPGGAASPRRPSPMSA